MARKFTKAEKIALLTTCAVIIVTVACTVAVRMSARERIEGADGAPEWLVVRNADTRIDVNRASQDELCELYGIGPAKAKRIIAAREASGGFLTTEEFRSAAGLGEAAFARIADRIKLGG